MAPPLYHGRSHGRPGLGPGARRERLIQIALVVLLFGCFSMVVRVSQLAGTADTGSDRSRLHVNRGSIRHGVDGQTQVDETPPAFTDMAEEEHEFQDTMADPNAPVDSEEPPLKAAESPEEPVDDIGEVQAAENGPVDREATEIDSIPFPQATSEEPGGGVADGRVDDEFMEPTGTPADADTITNAPEEQGDATTTEPPEEKLVEDAATTEQPDEEPSTTEVVKELPETENPVTELPTTTAPATEDEEPTKEPKPKRRRKKRKGKKKSKKKKPTDTPAPSPTPKKTLSAEELLKQQQQCVDERDFGLIDALRSSKKEYCASSDDQANGLSSVTTFKVPGGLRATLFRGLTMDFNRVRIFHPIRSLAQDGGGHDPRFVFTPNIIHCDCPELVQYAATRKRTELDRRRNKTVVIADPLRLWDPFLASVPSRIDHPSTVCAAPRNILPQMMTGRKNRNGTAGVTRISDPVILITRRDDHNPFFQISNALNAWILMRALDWDPAQTQVIHLDAGYPSPVDALHQRLLSPNRPLISGRLLMEQRVEFTSQVLLAPFETDGPLMQHLNNDEPCFNSLLIQEFRQVSLQALNVIKSPNVDEDQPEEGDQVTTTAPPSSAAAPVVVTIITRRAYGGRMVQRRWRNEDEVLDAMRAAYADRNIHFDSVDFVTLELNEQMRIMVESDVVIGMHGAGMVNVLWTRPEALVIEIFPFKRKRWGYRNLCQFLGCSWIDFRGGKDIRTGKEDNANDKVIPFEEFFAFFDPLLTQHLAGHGRSLEPVASLNPTDPDELQRLLD